MESAYRGQFITKRSDPVSADGRAELLRELRKMHARGPTKPDSLAKRAVSVVDDLEMRRMVMTAEDRRLRSNADAALVAIHKALGTQSSRDVMLKAASGRAARAASRPVSFSRRDIAGIMECARRLRKDDARTPPALRQLPGQSSNAMNIDADPARVGGTSSIAGWQDPMWRDAGSTKVPPPQAESVSASNALPSDADDDGADELAGDGADKTTKWIKRAHSAPPRKGW